MYFLVLPSRTSLFNLTWSSFIIYMFRVTPPVLALYGNFCLTFKLRSSFCHSLYFDVSLVSIFSFVYNCVNWNCVINQVLFKLSILHNARNIIYPLYFLTYWLTDWLTDFLTVNYFRKKLHLGCLKGLWIHLWDQRVSEQGGSRNSV